MGLGFLLSSCVLFTLLTAVCTTSLEKTNLTYWLDYLGNCPSIPNLMNGWYHNNFGMVHFYCNPQYHLSGPTSLQCKDGYWEPSSFPNCLPKCLKPSIDNGTVFNPTEYYKPNERVTVYCNEGFKLLGSRQLVCNEDSSWSSFPEIIVAPFCTEILCPHPEELPNGSIEIDAMTPAADGFKVGTRAILKCNKGYQLSMGAGILTNSVSSNVRSCLKGGLWSGSSPSCSPLSCGEPFHIVNGYYEVYPGLSQSNSQDRFPPSTMLQYFCYSGYSLNGPGKFECTMGSWSPFKSPVCTPLPNLTEPSKRCPLPQNITHASVTLLQGWMGSNIVADGTILQYMCHHGYRDLLQPCSIAKISCKKGLWEGMFPHCEPFSGCLSPPPILHGHLMGHASHYRISSKVYYKCNGGYALLGPPVITCQQNGCWSPSAEPWCEVLPDFPIFPSVQYQPRHYENIFHGKAMALISIAGASMVFLLVIIIILLQRRYKSYHTLRLAQQLSNITSNPSPDIRNSNDTDRVALIAFADGVQVVLPSYEEAIQNSCSPPPYDSISRTPQCTGRNARHNIRRYRNNDTFVHPTSCMHNRSNLQSVSLGDSIGSTDTITQSFTGSEVSATLTFETTSSNLSNSSQAHSCRALAGSFASFDTVSNVITDDVPLLEENEKCLSEVETPVQ